MSKRPLSASAQEVLRLLTNGATLTSYGPDATHAHNVVERTPGNMYATIAFRYLMGVQPAIVRRLLADGYIVADRQADYTYPPMPFQGEVQTVHATHYQLIPPEGETRHD